MKESKTNYWAWRLSRLAMLLIFSVLLAVLPLSNPVMAAPLHRAVASASCYGSSCTGRDPSTTSCVNDAETVRSMEVDNAPNGAAGQLDLRYSPSCRANWGRFTIFMGARFYMRASQNLENPIYGGVTVWNPGGPSQGTVQGRQTITTTWSYMTNGLPTACTGVEVLWSDGSNSPDDVKPWVWGPCY